MNDDYKGSVLDLNNSLCIYLSNKITIDVFHRNGSLKIDCEPEMLDLLDGRGVFIVKNSKFEKENKLGV